MPPRIDETTLVDRLRARDRRSFEYFYDHYSGALYGVIFRILNNEKVSEEVLHDTFIRIWDRIGQYDETRGKLFTWIVNIARNLAIDKIRSKEIVREKKTDGLDAVVDSIEDSDGLRRETDAIGLDNVLKGLPREQQFVVEYLYFKGYSQAELAKDFNIPLGTIKTRLRAALQKLRSALL